MVWLGVALTVAGAGLLIYYIFGSSGLQPAQVSQATGNIELIEKCLIGGVVAFAVGSAVTWWGEQILAPVQLMVGAALFFAPAYIPMMASGGSSPEAVPARALEGLHNAGLVLGLIGLLVLMADVVSRVKDRSTKGTRSDQLKYGKGIKQEDDRQRVWMGKCWQLPYCRKFVRERCPIYHSKRTCWKELVGCMCEEQVIRDAMENKVIPKDALLAEKMIPRNNKLTIQQKQERCKTCVIYNEHQRHKYQAYLPAVLVGFALVYLLGHGAMVEALNGLVMSGSKAVGQITLQGTGKAAQGNTIFAELLLGALFLVAVSYAMKFLEFAIFKLKI